ncbi:hypothetical protein ID866_11126 [Astraeus odoratus]|nr:hypothetical protein ID866_11126 [Astraeus odoratus]
MDLKKLCEFLVQSLSFLKGIALTWFEPDLLNAIPGDEPTWADDYSEFVIKLTTNFGPHGPVSDAEHQLDNLSMKDSNRINKYIVKFNCLATQVHGYGEGALCHMFYNRLPDRIKDEIAHVGKPPHLVNLCTMVQGIDARYWECKSEIACQTKKQSDNSSGTTSSSSAGKKPQQPSPSSPKPSSNFSTPDLSGVLGKDGKLTATEHLHRIKNALCLFCGLPGHSAKDCPRSMSHVAKAHATQAASIAASIVETPAKAKK